MNKHLSIIAVLMVFVFIEDKCYSSDFEMPAFHADVSIQSVYYIDEDDSLPYLSRPNDAVEIRHASVMAKGQVGRYIGYNVEIGLSTCTGGGCSGGGSLALSSAGIFFKPVDYLKIGYSKGHVMRGFELYEECTEVLTAEKPRFRKIFPCHPIGILIEADYMFDENMGINAQFTYNTGYSGCIENEHDINLGVQFKTPVLGFTVGGFYNDWQWKVNEYDPEIEDFFAEKYNGTRLGIGFDYGNQGINVRSEYYLIKGYNDPNPIRTYMVGSDTLHAEDVESSAFYIEGGYSLKTANDRIPYVRGYTMYQIWDKASNADGDNKLSYLTLGFELGLGSEEAHLKIDYEFPLDSPENTYDEAKRLIIRLTGGF